MSKNDKQDTAQRFGGEFGPYRKEGTPGVSLSTFKTLVWTSNIGGMLLVVIALEMLGQHQNLGQRIAALTGHQETCQSMGFFHITRRQKCGHGLRHQNGVARRLRQSTREII